MRGETVTLVAVVVGIVCAFCYSFASTDRIMSVEYCWDSEGNHYVYPDANCRV